MGKKSDEFKFEYKLTNNKTGETFQARGWKAVTTLAGLINCNSSTLKRTKKWTLEVVSDPETWDESTYRHGLYVKSKGKYADYEAKKKERDPLYERRKLNRLKGHRNYDGTPFTAEQHNEMLQLSCEVCGEDDDRLIGVDHCHETGYVRGPLCRKCNLSLGHANDSIETLQKLIEYLKRHNDKVQNICSERTK